LPICIIARGLTTIDNSRSRSACGEVGLSRNSWMPSRTASCTRARSARALSMMAGMFGLVNTPGERTMCMICGPLSTGRSQSSSTTSGLAVRMTSSAASPSAAS
jgi:hypothetical protein